MSSNDTKKTRFYKEYWFWIVMIPITSSVIVGSSFVYQAFATFDGVVVDNYYKDGKGIKVRVEEDRRAQANGLQATMVAVNNTVKAQIGGTLASYPDQLDLIFIYPYSDKYDIELVMEHLGDGEYQAEFFPEVQNRYLVQLHTQDGAENAWRLHGETNLPLVAPIILKPKLR
jgi:uncharacterized protein